MLTNIITVPHPCCLMMIIISMMAARTLLKNAFKELVSVENAIPEARLFKQYTPAPIRDS